MLVALAGRWRTVSPCHGVYFGFPAEGKMEANERSLSMRAREDGSLLASTEGIPQSQQQRIDRFI